MRRVAVSVAKGTDVAKCKIDELVTGLYRIKDLCNVYLLKRGERALAVDFGAGAWLPELTRLGIRKLDHVFLTHHHRDQCEGLLARRPRGVSVHAPAASQRFLKPAEVRRLWRRRHGAYPASFALLPRGIARVRYDMAEGTDVFWDAMRVRSLPTPGHGPDAHSVILNWQGRQIVFCGDAAHAGATLWQPYNLEWDHWRCDGALQAWSGVNRLAQVGMDLLCPSHGPVIDRRPAAVLRALARKLRRFYESKLSICPGEKDEYWPARAAGPRIKQVLPRLYSVGRSGYLLLSERGEALAVDPNTGDLEALVRLHRRLGRPRITAALVSHFHSDHCSALPILQKRFGARACLHPRVAEPIADCRAFDVPYLPAEDIHPDELLPERGTWAWNEYRFRVAPFPAQTWWHAAHMAEVDGVKVFFGGDNFQPGSRWGGTGGYSAINGSRFREGFARSAKLVTAWAPDLLCNGHGTFLKYRPSRFRKVVRWAGATEKAVKALCPSGRLETDSYLHHPGKPKPYPK